jgi:hypothetical protein
LSDLFEVLWRSSSKRYYKLRSPSFQRSYQTSPAEEREVVKEALDAGITVVTAAGNEHSDLDSKCDFFPACIDSRVVSVGCSDCVQSNTGKVIKIWEHGKAITAGGYTMTGTSQATAVFTGKLVKIMHDRAKKRSK